MPYRRGPEELDTSYASSTENLGSAYTTLGSGIARPLTSVPTERRRPMPFTSGIGVTELIIVLVIVLLIFGPKRLPGMGKALGSGMREFKDSISGQGSRSEEHTSE